MIDKKEALALLDEIENFRRHSNDAKAGQADFCLRYDSATIARAAGFKSRVEWTALLKADPKTLYAKDFANATLYEW